MPQRHICSEPGCRVLLTQRGRCAQHQRARRSERAQRPIERIYDSPRWRNGTRPAVLQRDGFCCVYCGQPATDDDPLTVAHLERTTQLLALGLDVYDPALSVAAHRTCHAANAPKAQAA